MRQAYESGWYRLGGIGIAIAVGALASGCNGDEQLSPQVAGEQNDAAARLPTWQELRDALVPVVQEGTDGNGGLGFNMWASIVDREGRVRVIVFSGDSPFDEWPGSRVISAQKANTANAFSLADFALSTANLYFAVQPGGTLFGLQESNPVNEEAAYEGDIRTFGTANDPLAVGDDGRGVRVGGINVFGGGLALYAADGTLLGGLGLSGDASCSDHIIAWKVRDRLGLDNVPAGVSSTGDDNIIYDLENGASASGFGHPECSDRATEIAQQLPETHPTGSNDQ